MSTSLPHSRPLFLGLAAVAILGCEGVFAQAVIPGEFTDQTNLRRLSQDASDYKTLEHLKFPYILTYYVKPTDGETCVITLRDCAFGAGVANAAAVSAARMDASGKKIAVKAEGVRFAEAEGAAVSTKD